MADPEHQSHDGAQPEPLQPDPYLREGAVSAWAKWAAAIAVAIVVCVVIYGLNASGPESGGAASQSAASPPAPAASSTTGSGGK